MENKRNEKSKEVIKEELPTNVFSMVYSRAFTESEPSQSKKI